ncbi:MAG: hypothetical protein ACOC12_08320 [Bacteroidota bacterium]
MKNIARYAGILLPVLLFAFASCEMQPTEEEFRESLSEINQEMQNASDMLGEAIEAEETGPLVEKSDEALNIIESQLDVYMEETDKAVRRIYEDTRTRIIDMKQKIAEIDFRTDLLQNTVEFTSDQVAPPGETPTVRRTRPVGYRFPYVYSEEDEEVVRDRIQYGEEVEGELKENLRELKGELDAFIQESL